MPGAFAEPIALSSAIALALSAAGYLGSTVGSPKIMPRKSHGKRTKGRGGSHGATGFAPENRADLQVRPPTALDVPRSVPRGIPNQVVWDVVKFLDTITTGGAIAEVNYSYSLSSNPQVSSWVALFDQWTIPQFSITYESLLPPGSTVVPARLYTALDFDNVTALGSLTAIEDYSTCQEKVMEPGATVMRSIKPCCKEVTTSSGQGLARLWIDSATPGVPFYGIRSILPATAGVTTTAVTTTVWYAFRNQI